MPIYRRLSIVLLAMACFVALPLERAEAGSITVGSLPGGGDLRVVVDPGSQIPYGTIHPGIMITSFRICWKKSSQWANTCAVHYTDVITNMQTGTADIGGFTAGNKYRIDAWCNCFTGNGWADVYIGHIIFTYPAPPALLASDRVRIRNVATSQCSYVEAFSFNAKHWVCWPDPNMVFYRDRYADGYVQLRDARSGRCLWGGPANVSATGSATCGSLGTRFQILNGSGGQVRLFVPVTGTSIFSIGYGGCLYADGGNGGAMLRESCNGAARDFFVLDPA